MNKNSHSWSRIQGYTNSNFGDYIFPYLFHLSLLTVATLETSHDLVGIYGRPTVQFEELSKVFMKD